MAKGKRVGSTLPKRDANAIFSRRAALMSFVGVGVMGTILFRMAQLQTENLFSGQYTDAAECFARALQLREQHGADAALVESSQRALARADEERSARERPR